MIKNIALLISIISCIVFFIGMNLVADSIGISTYIDFGETGNVTSGYGKFSYVEEVDGELTSVGLYITIISFMFACRIFYWIMTGKINGSFSKESHLLWLYCLIGLTAYILLTTPIWLFEIPATLERILVFLCGLGIFLITFSKYNNAINKINTNDRVIR